MSHKDKDLYKSDQSVVSKLEYSNGKFVFLKLRLIVVFLSGVMELSPSAMFILLTNLREMSRGTWCCSDATIPKLDSVTAVTVHAELQITRSKVRPRLFTTRLCCVKLKLVKNKSKSSRADFEHE